MLIRLAETFMLKLCANNFHHLQLVFNKYMIPGMVMNDIVQLLVDDYNTFLIASQICTVTLNCLKVALIFTHTCHTIDP